MILLHFVVVRQRKILRSSDPDNSYYRYFWFVKVPVRILVRDVKLKARTDNFTTYALCITTFVMRFKVN